MRVWDAQRVAGICLFLFVFSLGTELVHFPSLAVARSRCDAADSVFHHEQVLGTSMELRVSAETQVAAEIEQLVLAEIDRLNQIFSRYDRTSELMRWQNGEIDRPSSELTRVLERAEYWRTLSGGAFDMRAVAIGEVWRKAASTGQAPDRDALHALTQQLHDSPLVRDSKGTLKRSDRLAISLDAIAKGFILDEVCERVQAAYPNLRGMTVMIGGDLRKIGSSTEQLGIADPNNASVDARPIAELTVHSSLSMATSGGYRRNVQVAGRTISHIIDPRTGLPADSLGSVSVIAPCAMDADAAATAVAVLGIDDGLKLIDRMPGFACLVVTNAGQVVASQGWPTRSTDTTEITAGSVASSMNIRGQVPGRLIALVEDAKPKNGLLVKFTLGKADGGRYRRPYVAVWLEDKDGFPVKTAVLWLQTDGPGPRWHRDLTRWWADDRMRKLVEEKELIGTISGATRGPGEYEARFDMTDNLGQPLKPGRYTLCLEAAREHGTHHLIREDLELKDTVIAKKELKAGTEFSAASYQYEPVSTTAAKR